MEARQVKGALSAMRNKTDKHDARGIAQILRSGWYSQVHVKSMQSHHIRMLLSSRKAVLSKCVDLENEVRGLFKIFGIKLPPKLGHGAFDTAVRDIIEADEALSHPQDGACRCGLCSAHERARCRLYHRTHVQGRCR
jgi:transposase